MPKNLNPIPSHIVTETRDYAIFARRLADEAILEKFEQSPREEFASVQTSLTIAPFSLEQKKAGS